MKLTTKEDMARISGGSDTGQWCYGTRCVEYELVPGPNGPVAKPTGKVTFECPLTYQMAGIC